MYILNPLVNHHLHFVLPHMFGIYFSIYSEFSGHIPEILGNAGMRPVPLPLRVPQKQRARPASSLPRNPSALCCSPAMDVERSVFCAWGSDQKWMEWSHGLWR